MTSLNDKHFCFQVVKIGVGTIRVTWRTRKSVSIRFLPACKRKERKTKQNKNVQILHFLDFDNLHLRKWSKRENAIT